VGLDAPQSVAPVLVVTEAVRLRVVVRVVRVVVAARLAVVLPLNGRHLLAMSRRAPQCLQTVTSYHLVRSVTLNDLDAEVLAAIRTGVTTRVPPLQSDTQLITAAGL